MQNARAEYVYRLRVRRERLHTLVTRVRACRVARNFMALAVLVTLWMALVVHLVSLWTTAAAAISGIALAVSCERLFERARSAQRSVAFYERALDRVEHRWIGQGNTTTSALPQHPYAIDLDIFGRGSLYELLCTARTQSGQRTLASWLSAPGSIAEILGRQAAIRELRDRLDLREEIASLGREHNNDESALVIVWIRRPQNPFSKLASRAAPVLVLFTLCAGLCSLFSVAPWLLPIAAVAQATFALYHRQRARTVIGDVEEAAAEIELLHAVLLRISNESFVAQKLKSLQASESLRHVRRLLGFTSLLRYRRDPAIGPFLSLFLWSTQLAFAIECWRRQFGVKLQQTIEVIGEFEALCALASYAFEHVEDPFPEFVKDGPVLEATALQHPLLQASVPNSVSLDKESPVLVISGSNMSGKSTLLRTVGINVVLAQAGAPVRAKRLKLSALSLGATIRIQDSLQDGVSRLQAEVQHINQITDTARQGLPVLFLFDELLHGANAHVRSAGAATILEHLLAHQAIGIITTHDLTLAQAPGAMRPITTAHFEDSIQNGRLTFDYKLKPGNIATSHPLEVMRALGLNASDR